MVCFDPGCVSGLQDLLCYGYKHCSYSSLVPKGQVAARDWVRGYSYSSLTETFVQARPKQALVISDPILYRAPSKVVQVDSQGS